MLTKRLKRSLSILATLGLTSLSSIGLAAAQDADARAIAAKDLAAKAAGPWATLPKIKLGIVQLNAQAEVAFRIAEGARIPAEELGWEVIVCDSLGDPARMASCGSSLINQGVSAIMAVAIEPGPVMAQLRDAKARNIPWIIIGGGTSPNDLITAQYAPLETEMSHLLHAYLIERLKERGDGQKTIAISTFSQVWAGRQRSDALYKDLADTNIFVVDEHVSDLSNQIADARHSVSQQLTAYPDVDALLATADYPLPVMGQLVAQAYPGKAFPERPLVVGYLDDLVNLDSIRKGESDALTTMRLDAASWVAVDQVASMLARGTELNKDAYLKSADVYGMDMTEAALITAANLPAEGAYVEPEGDFETFFRTKWNLEYGIGGS
jgi:ABC-type sugar transport system substrate-binding protein